MKAKVLGFVQWVVLGGFTYVGLGCLAFPDWWYAFLFQGNWHSVDVWARGIGFLLQWLRRTVFYEIPRQPVSLAILIGIVIAWRVGVKRGIVDRPALGPMNWRHQLAAAIIFVLGLATAWMSEKSDTLSSQISAELAKDLGRTTSDRVSPNQVRDFAYIDTARVGSLFDQVVPAMQLSEVSTERSSQDSLEGQIGVDKVVGAKAGVSSGKKAVERYTATQVTSSRQVDLLLKYFGDKRELAEYESLEIDSERLRALGTLVDLLKQYQISHDSRKLAAVTKETLQKTVDEQRSHFESVRTPIVVRGVFQAAAKGDAVGLTHLFFFRESMIAIRFEMEPFQKNGRDVLSNTIRRIDVGNSVDLRLGVFGRVVSVARGTDELRIIVSPYAAWHW